MRKAISNSMLFGVLALFYGCSRQTITPSDHPVKANAPSHFVAVGNLNTARANHVAVLLPNGKVLLAGGISIASDEPQPLASAELFDPETRSFTPTGSMSVPRISPGAVLLGNGKVLVVGGSHDLSTEVYDPSTGAFTSAGNMISEPAVPPEVAFDCRRPTLLQDGKVFIQGLNAQIYDPITGAFSLTTPYIDTDGYPLWNTSTLLQNGKVLLTGYAQKFQEGVTELYDPRRNTFSPAGSLVQWQDVNTASLLMDGRVLFVGSDEMEFPADASIYDPLSNSFAFIGKTIGPHEFSAAALLPNGGVLITGGQRPGGGGSAVADLYDPSSGKTEGAGLMTVGRHSHTAIPLSDGTVLIAGGYSIWPNATNRAEMYIP